MNKNTNEYQKIFLFCKYRFTKQKNEEKIKKKKLPIEIATTRKNDKSTKKF